MSNPSPIPRDHTDRLTRALWRRAPDALLRLALGDQAVTVRQLLDTNTALVKRAPDGAALAEDASGPFVGHLEFELNPPVDVPLRMAMYGLILHEHYRLPVRGAVMLMAPAGPVDDHFLMRHGGATLCVYGFHVVRLYEVPAMELASSVDLAPLSPLGAGADLDVMLLARDTLRAQAPPDQRADLLAALYILGGRRFDAAWLHRVLTQEELMESSTYREILEQGFEKGIEKGFEKGIAQGERDLLARMISLRFPADAPRLTPLLEGCDHADLGAIAEALLAAPDAEGLHALILARLHDRGD